MKILHATQSYYPDACGGVERYVDTLCQSLAGSGIENVVACPGSSIVNYVYQGVRVHRFATRPGQTNEILDAEGDPVSAASFAQLLELEKPSIVHFHTRSEFINVRCLREVRRRGIPAISTFHDPSDYCERGTLMRWGNSPCDGRIRPKVCAACVLNGKETPKPLALLIATTSRLTSPLARLPSLPSALKRVLRIEPQMHQIKRTTEEWLEGMSCVAVLNNWSQHPLRLNGMPLKRIRQVRHGLVHRSDDAPPKSIASSLPLRLAIFGPFDCNSGFDLIASAMRMAPELPITLDLYPSPFVSVDRTAQRLLDHAMSDPRITYREEVPPSKSVEVMRNYHALLVPTRRMETGPLVVLEAFAAGIPVIGSNFGGISEWVKDELNGLLVADSLTVEAWKHVLNRLVAEPELLPRLRAGVRPPRTMADVASKMLEIYRYLMPGAEQHAIVDLAAGTTKIRNAPKLPYGCETKEH